MDPIERAIRNALSKGDAGNPAYRQRVYASGRTALERTAAGPAPIAPELLAARLKSLAAAISVIEEEFLPAVEHFEELAEPPAPPPVIRTGPQAEMQAVPPVEASAAAREPDTRNAMPEFPQHGFPEASAPRLDAAEEARSPQTARRRSRLGRFFLWSTIIALLAVGGWWVATSGVLKSVLERDTSVPNPPAKLGEEEFEPKQGETAPVKPGETEASWVDIFTPADPAGASAPSGASAEVTGADAAKALKISSGAEGAAVLFDVGQGVLEQVSGKRAVFDIIARSADGKPVQIAVTCNFGELGDCGRRRYDVAQDKADFLFEVELPAVNPGAAGSIAIVADVEGAGRSVEIFGLRVSAAPAK